MFDYTENNSDMVALYFYCFASRSWLLCVQTTWIIFRSKCLRQLESRSIYTRGFQSFPCYGPPNSIFSCLPKSVVLYLWKICGQTAGIWVETPAEKKSVLWFVQQREGVSQELWVVNLMSHERCDWKWTSCNHVTWSWWFRFEWVRCALKGE